MPRTKYKKKIKNGYPYYFYRYTHPKLKKPRDLYGKTVRDLMSKIEALKYDLENDVNIDKKLFGKELEKWLLRVHLIGKKEATETKYKSLFKNYIQGYPIYKLQISELRITEIQKHYDRMISAGASYNTLKLVNSLIAPFIRYLFSRGMIDNDFSSSIIVPKIQFNKNKNTRPSRALTLDEQEALESVIKGTKWEALIMTDLYTGLRLGEILALTWFDVDLDKGCISVTKSYNEKAKGLKVSTPKTKSSIRTVPLPPHIIGLLKQHQENQYELSNKLGNKYADTKIVFDNGYGRYISKSTLKRALDDFAIKTQTPGLSVKYGLHFHDLRDTFATRIYAKTKDIKIVQALLGHSDIKTTANIYTEVHYDETLSNLYQ